MFDDFSDDDAPYDGDDNGGFSLFDDASDSPPTALTADEFPAFEHARSSQILMGHEEAEMHLLQLANDKRLPQGLLISGPEGIGKATLAWRLARFLLANPDIDGEEGGGLFGEALPPPPLPTSLNVPVSSTVFRAVAANAHPDLLTIEFEENEKTGKMRNEIVVEQIRRINDFMHLKPSVDGGWRVVIIDNADTMNLSTQNALLKILEEPPPRAILLLVAHRQGRLLPTIFSRVQRLPLRRLDDATCKALLAQSPLWHSLPSDQQDICLRLGHGAPGAVLQLAGGLANSGFDKILSELMHYEDNKLVGTNVLTELIGGAGGDDRFAMFRLLLTAIVRHATLLRHGAANTPPMPAMLQPLLDNLMRRRSGEGLVQLYDGLQDIFGRALQQHLDRRGAVMEVLALWRATR